MRKRIYSISIDACHAMGMRWWSVGIFRAVPNEMVLHRSEDITCANYPARAKTRTISNSSLARIRRAQEKLMEGA